MLCQLKCLDQSVVELPLHERLRRTALKKIMFIVRNVTPIIGTVMDRSVTKRQEKPSGDSNSDKVHISTLNLREGEWVRVKSFEDIKTTLDENNKFQGLSFTFAQKKFCGGTYRVFKRLERVFDERKWKLSRIKNVVLLENVYCDGAGGIDRDWDGCDRMCFLWWKEIWLERVPEE